MWGTSFFVRDVLARNTGDARKGSSKYIAPLLRVAVAGMEPVEVQVPMRVYNANVR